MREEGGGKAEGKGRGGEMFERGPQSPRNSIFARWCRGMDYGGTSARRAHVHLRHNYSHLQDCPGQQRHTYTCTCTCPYISADPYASAYYTFRDMYLHIYPSIVVSCGARDSYLATSLRRVHVSCMYRVHVCHQRSCSPRVDGPVDMLYAAQPLSQAPAALY